MHSPLRSLCEGPVRKSPVKSALRRRQPPKSTYRAGERYAVHPRRRVGRPPKVGCRTLWPVCQSCKRQWGAGARACSAIGQIDGEWPETDALVGCERQEAAPQAQDYTYGRRDVPAPVQLVVCGYLDVTALGRLEVCGRHFDAVRAWNTKAAGLARGTLGDLSTKQFLRAQTRARALVPRWVGGTSGPFMFQPSRRPVSFDEFAFTIVVTWCEGVRPARRRCFTEFPFMRVVSDNQDEQGEFSRPPSMFVFVPPAGADHEAFSACLRRVSQEFAEADGGLFPGDELDRMHPVVYMTCTRRRDGAATRVGMFSRLHAVNDCVADEETEGNLYFGDGKLLLTNVPGEALEITLHIMWDASSGRVRAFGCHVYANGEHGYDEFPEETFLALLRARLDESENGTVLERIGAD